MIWEPVDFDNQLTSLGKGSSFFLQQIPGKYLLFIHQCELTSLFVLHLEEDRLIVDCVKIIQSEHSVVRITGNNNCILMLDVMDELFFLKGTLGNIVDTFNQNTANKFVTDDGVLSWIRVHKLNNCLAVTGITNGISVLHHNESVYAAHYGTAQITTGLCDISKERLTDFDAGMNYFVARLTGDIARLISEKVFKALTPVKEVLLVIKPSEMYFIIPTPNGQILSKPYSIDFQTDIIINVLIFKKKGEILIIGKSGKIVCLTFSDCRTFTYKHAWLPKAVSAIIGYETDKIYLLSSDLNKLYMSSMDDDYVITNIQVTQNIRGVRHFIQIGDNIMVITINGCLYETRIGCVVDEELQGSSNVLMSKMFQTGKEMEKLIEEVKAKEDLIKVLEISRIPDISDNIIVSEKDGVVVIENKTEELFQKGLWRIFIESEDDERKHFEVKELENDMIPGGSLSFKCEKIPSDVTLVCDVMDNVVTIELHVESKGESPENDEHLIGISQFLKEKCTFIA